MEKFQVSDETKLLKNSDYKEYRRRYQNEYNNYKYNTNKDFQKELNQNSKKYYIENVQQNKLKKEKIQEYQKYYKENTPDYKQKKREYNKTYKDKKKLIDTLERQSHQKSDYDIYVLFQPKYYDALNDEDDELYDILFEEYRKVIIKRNSFKKISLEQIQKIVYEQSNIIQKLKNIYKKYHPEFC